MTKHIQKQCNCKRDNCVICEGVLFICEVCGCAEGELTTDCCGYKLSEEIRDRIYKKGNLDFKNGQWVNEPNYPRGKQSD
jgi:hypothetical protein